jgi:hypothetical protein
MPQQKKSYIYIYIYIYIYTHTHTLYHPTDPLPQPQTLSGLFSYEVTDYACYELEYIQKYFSNISDGFYWCTVHVAIIAVYSNSCTYIHFKTATDVNI